MLPTTDMAPTFNAMPLPQGSYRRVKSCCIMAMIWATTAGLHFLRWGVWFVLALALLLSIDLVLMLLALPKESFRDAPPPLKKTIDAGLEEEKTDDSSEENEEIESPSFLPFMTLLVSAKNEEAVIGSLVKQLGVLGYPEGKLELWVVDDNSSDNTYALLEELKPSFSQLNLHKREEGAMGGKSGALNEVLALIHPETDVVGVFDADAGISEELLKEIVPYFVSVEKLGAIQVRKAISNQGFNILTKCQELEMIFDSFLSQKRVLSGGLGDLRGNGQFVRKAALDHVGGWNEETVTDDLDLSFRLQLNGWKVQTIFPNPSVQEEGVVTITQLWHQRNRWAEGGYQRYLDYGYLIVTFQFGFYKTIDACLFFLIQYALPMSVLPDMILSVVFWRLPLLAPLANVTFLLFFVASCMGLMQSHKQSKNSNIFGVALLALQNSLYLCHWLLISIFVTSRMCIFPKRFKWVKTEHKGSSSSYCN